MGTEGIQDKYVNPYTDFGFKLLFGTAMNKELLISFLNALLFKEEVIKDVTYLNAEHLGTQEYDRRAVFDVYCENEKGEKFLVEMQRGEQQFFKDRSVFYSTLINLPLFILRCLNSIRLRMSWIVCLTSGFLFCVTLPLCLNVPEHYRTEFLTASLKLRR